MFWIRQHVQGLLKTYKEMAISLAFQFLLWEC